MGARGQSFGREISTLYWYWQRKVAKVAGAENPAYYAAFTRAYHQRVPLLFAIMRYQVSVRSILASRYISSTSAGVRPSGFSVACC